MNPTAEATSLLFDFGTDATLSGQTIRGIFDNANTAALGLLGSNPTFTCQSSDAVDAKGLTLTVNGTSYTVREAKPDGTGFSLLELEEQ